MIARARGRGETGAGGSRLQGGSAGYRQQIQREGKENTNNRFGWRKTVERVELLQRSSSGRPAGRRSVGRGDARRASSRGAAGAGVALGPEHADVGQGAVLLVKIEPIAHNKLVWHLKAKVVGFVFNGSPGGLAEEGSHAHRRRALLRHRQRGAGEQGVCSG